MPEKFTQTTLGAIARDGAAKTPRRNDPESIMRELVGTAEQNQIPHGDASSMFLDRGELSVRSQLRVRHQG